MFSASRGSPREQRRLMTGDSTAPAPSSSRRLLLPLVGVLLLLAGLRLVGGFERLLFAPPAQRSTGFHLAVGDGAVDLMTRRFETRDFFARRGTRTGVYPPASYAMLWPFLASGSVSFARWTWAAVLAAALAWLSTACARATGFREPLARLVFGLLPLAFLATSAMIAVGQVTAVVLALLVASVPKLTRAPRSWRDGAVGGVLFALAAVKPTMAAPFGWLLVFLPGSFVPAAVSAGVYGGLTALALLLRDGGAAVVNAAAVTAPSGVASPGPATAGAGSGILALATSPSRDLPRLFAAGHVNLQNLLVDLGIGAPWVMIAPLVAVAALGPWAWRHRRDDPWILLGVAGLVARFGFYHRVYDDLLVLPALVALARLVSGAVERPGRERAAVPPGIARAASAILVASAIGMLLPRDFPPSEIRMPANACAWAAALALLVVAVRPGAVGGSDAPDPLSGRPEGDESGGDGFAPATRSSGREAEPFAAPGPR